MGNQASQDRGASVTEVRFDPRLEALFDKLAQTEPGQDPCITEDGFRQLFGTPLPGFATVMFNAIAPNPGSGSVGRHAFLVGAQETLNLTGLSSQIKYYHDVFFERDGVTEEGVRSMVHTAYALCLASIHLDAGTLKGDTSILDSLSRSIMKTCGEQTEQKLNVVIQTHYVHLFSGLHTWVQNTLLQAQTGPNEELVAAVQERYADSMIDLPMAWVLSCILPIRYTQNRAELAAHSKLPKWLQWSQLYSSRQHGQSMNRFEHHVFSYKGPTILLISCTGGFTFCIAVDTEWKESTAAWGGMDCMILQLTPEVWVLEEGEGMMFVNHHARTVKNGIFFGRNFDNPLLRLQNGLDSLETTEGELAIASVEVWGSGDEGALKDQQQREACIVNRCGVCGDEGALKEQQLWRDWEHRQAERTQRVKRPGREDWQDNPDKFLLDMAGVETSRPQERPGM